MIHEITSLYYLGRNLSREQEQVGFKEMERIHFQLPMIASSLKARDDTVFASHLLRDETITMMSPVAWWRSSAAYSIRILPKMVEACEVLMILPSSTAALERAFSTMGNIITKKRNRLGIEKARKLAVVNKTLSKSIVTESDEDE